MSSSPASCRWLSLKEALTAFVLNEYGHQGQMHIKPLHWYTACRLIIEGGFHPDDVTPHPPFAIQQRRGQPTLVITRPWRPAASVRF